MSKIVIPSAAVGRRQVMASAGAAGLVSALAMPAIAQNKPIRMGWIAAVTGMFASNAQAQDWGFHMAVADLNEKGGLLGRKVEVVMRDSAADPSKAVSFAKELVFNENIDVLCGPIKEMFWLKLLPGAEKPSKLPSLPLNWVLSWTTAPRFYCSLTLTPPSRSSCDVRVIPGRGSSPPQSTLSPPCQ